MTGRRPSFGARLRAAMARRGPLCAGIDPHPALLRDWGLEDSVAGLERFALTATEALGPEVAVLKPQSAFFERFGAAGVAVLERVVALGREAGAQVVLDVKRGDIGSTAQAYADAYLDPRSPLTADAITASPFLGFGSLEPMLATASAHGAGVIVLALTSNPEGASVQRARMGGVAGTAGVAGTDQSTGTVAGAVLEGLRRANAAAGEEALGSFGAVVGATIGEAGEDLAIGGPLLVPGLGAQGGTPDDVRRIFAGVLPQVLASSSREILRAGPDQAALVDAARRTTEGLREVLHR